MKLISIDIQNIASVESFSLDFTQEPIASSRVFLICGEMGTGKTTLLDSICLALYGTTPRLSQASEKKLDYGEKDDISSRDPRHLLRRGAMSASVTLCFEDDEQMRYTATWSVSRNRKHNLNAVVRTLTYGGQTYSKNDEVKEGIIRAVGLDFEQFCRTTMLAQGQFTQFLKSKDDEKSEILEKLTNTGRYGELGAMVATITSEKKRAYEEQHSKVQGFQLLDDDELETLKQQIQEEEDLLSEKKVLKEAEEKNYQWVIRKHELDKEMGSLKEKLESIENQFNTSEMQEERMLLEDWRKSTKAIEWKRQLEEYGAKDRIYQAQVKECEKRYQLLLGGNEFEQQRLQTLRQKLEHIEKNIQEEEAHRAVYESFQTIREKLENAFAKLKEQRLHQTELQNKQEKIPHLELILKDLEAQCRATEQTMKQKNQSIFDLEAEIKKLDQEALLEESQTLKTDTDKLNKIEKITQSLESAIHLYDRAEESLRDIKNKIKEKNEEKVLLETQRKQCQEQYDKARQLFDASKLKVGDEARYLRSQLKKGDICPVCGQIVQDIAIEGELQKLFEPYEKDLKEKEAELTKIKTSCMAAEKLLHQYHDTDYPKMFKNWEDAGKQRDESLLLLVKSCDSLFCTETIHADSQTIEKIKAWAKERRNSLIQRGEANTKHLAQVTAKQQTLSSWRREYDKLLEGQGLLLKNRDEASQNLEAYNSDIKHLNDLIERVQNETEERVREVNELMGTEDWQQAWKFNHLQFINDFQNKVLKYNNLITDRLNLQKQKEELSQKLERIRELAGRVGEKWTDWLDVQPYQTTEISDIEAKWSSLMQDSANLKISMSNLQEERVLREQNLRLFREENKDITEARLAQLSALHDRQIAEMEQKHQRLRETLQSTIGAVKGKREEFEAHVGKKPETLRENEDYDVNVLEHRCTVLGQEYSEMLESFGKKKGIVEMDAKNRAKVMAEAEIEQRMKKDYEQWSQLNSLYGRDGGKAFRNIAQSYLLGNLLKGANAYLQQLDKRYQLDHIPGTLTISLRDCYQPGVQSPVSGLSGGESFLVSLSLALALSAVSKKGLNIDILFIDEGFGTLGSNEIDRVVTLLENLQRLQGKRVGVISHINYLKERIPVHIEAKRMDANRSQLRVVDATR